VAVGVAVALRVVLFGTRIGITMRAVVDDRALAALTGGRPRQASSLAWALGSSLAALAGILLAPVLQLNVQALTLLVVNAYAAAMFGRLRSLPLTFVGAVILGLLESYAVGYLPTTGVFANIRLAIPTLMLFVVLRALPEVRLRSGSDVAARMPRMPTLRRSVLAGAVLVLLALAFAQLSSDDSLAKVGHGLALGIVALSLVPLTGWAGQVSLCQMTFAGIGAFAAVKVAPDGGALGLVAAAALAAPVGALVALPALRLRGLYLALATLAFAVLMDNVFFSHERVFGDFGTLRMGRLAGFESEGAYFVLLAAVFAVVAVGLLALRRGPFGRRLSALRDSPAACTTLGLDLTATKLVVFALSSAIAGVGGALLAGLELGASARPFAMFQSLPLVLLAVLGGITATSGALVGGLVLAGFPVLAETPALASFALLGPGFIGITLARQPDGLVLHLSDLWHGRRRRAREVGMPAHIEDLGVAVPFEPAHAEALNRALAVEGV
jgi:branched-chain amino acid transport system permease protein